MIEIGMKGVEMGGLFEVSLPRIFGRSARMYLICLTIFCQMSPNSADDGESAEPNFVYCRSCGLKASSGWTFCRSCESSLDDAVPPDKKQEFFEEVYGKKPDSNGDAGCPKCGRAEAEVELVETTGIAVTALVAAQNNRFRVVSCTHCQYCEFYKGGDPELLINLFLET